MRVEARANSSQVIDCRRMAGGGRLECSSAPLEFGARPVVRWCPVQPGCPVAVLSARTCWAFAPSQVPWIAPQTVFEQAFTAIIIMIGTVTFSVIIGQASDAAALIPLPRR